MAEQDPSIRTFELGSTSEVNHDQPAELITMDNSLQIPPEDWSLDDVASTAFNSIEDAQLFLNDYAKHIGFSLRKDRVYTKRNEQTMRRFVCNKEGKRSDKNMNADFSSDRRRRHITRCGCLASFKVRRNDNSGSFHIVEFNSKHNHVLLPSRMSHILCSHRNVDEASAHHIQNLAAAGIKPSQIMDVLVSNRGGHEWVGFTRVDLYNHIYKSAENRITDNDVDSALYFIQALVQQDSGIVCRIHLDAEGRLNRLFFSDTISRSEYRSFGDVLICDSTYKTNHFRLPLVLLLGVDNHFSTILYAFALISDEEGETYKWVFDTFVACMEGKQPGVFVTDGDRAMRWAIRASMPLSRHRLCSWHIARNLNGVCRDKYFKSDFGKLMSKRYAEDLFLELWQDFQDKYKLHEGDSRWVQEMDNTKTMWAETYFSEVFCAATRTTQRAEGANNMLKRYVNVSLTLTQFLQKYLVFLNRLRESAMHTECINSQSMPFIRPNCNFMSIRTQLAETYTLVMFAKVDYQIEKAGYFTCTRLNLTGDYPWVRFKVERYDPNNSIYKCCEYVQCFKPDSTLVCSCGMMEFEGIPCRHMFAVMKDMQITKMSHSNITRRWMRNARDLTVLSTMPTFNVGDNSRRMSMLRPLCDRLAFFASMGDQQTAIATDQIERLTKEIAKLNMLHKPEIVQTVDRAYSTLTDPIILDPIVVRTKGAPPMKPATSTRTCTYCHVVGHTRRTCVELQQLSRQEGKRKKKV